MANPTTNYSFAMPTNTDLVKDLPADFDIFGQAVDDRIKALNPETTAGDISYRASTANAKSRLAIGTAGQVLTVNSGATAPEWTTISAGGLTLLSTTTLSTNSTTISAISGSYKHIHVIGRGIYSSANENIQIRFNSDTGSNYAWSRVRVSGTTVVGANATTNTSIDLLEDFTGSAWNTAGFFELLIPRYTESEIKAIWLRSLGSGDPAPRKVDWTQGTWNSTSAITSITLRNEGAGTTFSGGTVYVYGVS